MAFDIPSPAVPYYKPVEPVVPTPDNTAAKLISEGTATALQAFTHMAIARRQAELEQQKQLQDADLESRKLNILEQHGDEEFQLKKQLYDTYQTGADARLTTAKANLARFTSMAKARQDIQEKQQMFSDKVEADKKNLGLDDPNLQNDPVAFGLALDKFQSHWGQAPPTAGVKDQIAYYKNIADQQTIPVRFGAVKDPDKGWIGPEAKAVPIRQIFNGLRNPETQDGWLNGLMAAGLVTGKEEMVDKKTADGQTYKEKQISYDFKGPAQGLEQALRNKSQGSAPREGSMIDAGTFPKAGDKESRGQVYDQLTSGDEFPTTTPEDYYPTP